MIEWFWWAPGIYPAQTETGSYRGKDTVIFSVLSVKSLETVLHRDLIIK